MKFPRHFDRQVLAAICAALLFTAPGSSQARTYPDNKISMIVPAPAGGGTDFLARLVGKGMTQIMGQSVVVENLSGANGNIGAGRVARSAPDGYTVLMSYVGTQAINPTLYRHLGWKVSDLIPVAMVASYPFVIAVNPKVPAKSLDDLVKLARAEPGQLNFGSAGIGSGGHLVSEIFSVHHHVKLNHVPYQGSAPAVTDLLGGRIQLMFDTLSTLGPYVKSGRLRALAVTSQQRLPDYPDIPTVAELGYKDMQISGWYGVFVPKGTPEAIIQKLNTVIGQIVATPDYQQRLRKAGYEPFVYKTPAEFKSFVDSEIEKWGAAVKASGASVN